MPAVRSPGTPFGRRPMGVLREIRELPAAIRTLTAAIQDVAALQRESGPGEARLEDLERSRAKWEAEIEALLIKADSTYKSASNAESRARTMVRAYEKELDPFPEDSEEIQEPAVLPDHARPGEVEEVQPMHMDLAPGSKAYALRAKWS